uniref:Ig-like domain-containing protein n=1 Tax=Latimeria chalumnae TaxID=7897 RepID=H3AX28_LATCH
MKTKIIFLAYVLILMTRKTNGDQTIQKDSMVQVEEAQNVTLRCNYITTDSDPYLFWYFQRPGHSPKYILQRSKYSNNKESGFSRFDAQLGSEKTFHLNIENVEIEDGAVYYCALSRTVRHSCGAPVQNLPALI